MESFFRDAAINSRKETENTQSIDCVFYQSVMSRFIKKATTIKNGLFEIADIMWHKSGRFDFMPIRMKIEFISGIVNENMKLGDRYQPQYFIDNKKNAVSNPMLYI